MLIELNQFLSELKMQKLILLLLVVCSAIRINGQTFQYSRGWTNGKRSSASATDVPPLRQMTPNQLAQALTANDMNNRER